MGAFLGVVASVKTRWARAAVVQRVSNRVLLFSEICSLSSIRSARADSPLSLPTCAETHGFAAPPPLEGRGLGVGDSNSMRKFPQGNLRIPFYGGIAAGWVALL